jgi:S-adenosylmethionine decarboxylase
MKFRPQTASEELTFGMELVLDLADCDIEVITSSEKLAEYAQNLCKVIAMKPYGEPFVQRFGLDHPKTAGYSLVQLIETSSIVGHFSELWKTAYINIFSCKDFDPNVARDFTTQFFKAKVAKELVIQR